MKITKQAILQNIKLQFIHQNDMHDRKSNQPESQWNHRYHNNKEYDASNKS